MSTDQRLLDMEKLYREERHPLYVWWAISLRLALNEGAIPDWCIEYLDTCAANLSDLAMRSAETPTKKAAATAAALGITARGVNAFRGFAANARDIASAQFYENRYVSGGADATLLELGSKLGKNRSTAARRAAKGRRLLPIRQRSPRKD
jgi:hypothetical protein